MRLRRWAGLNEVLCHGCSNKTKIYTTLSGNHSYINTMVRCKQHNNNIFHFAVLLMNYR